MNTPEDANATNSNWGLVVPGRPATPSEGFAQSYHRVGPSSQQKTKKFDNGTCLRFGPEDLVDEFEPGQQENGEYQPFSNQIALVDRAVREIRSTRQRYEYTPFRAPQHNGDELESVHSDATALPHPFDNFRTQQLDGTNLPKITLACGPSKFTYTQIPSRFASCGDTPSVYDLPNKSDVQGLAHPGHTNDTRFGNSRPVGFGAMQQQIKRETDKYKHNARGLQMGVRRPRAKAWLENYGRMLEEEKAMMAQLQFAEGIHPPAAPRQMIEQRNHYAMIGEQEERKMYMDMKRQGLLGRQEHFSNLDGMRQGRLSGNQEEQSLKPNSMRQDMNGGNSGPNTQGSSAQGQFAERASFATRGVGVLGFPPDLNVPLTADQKQVNKQYHDRIAALEKKQNEDKAAKEFQRSGGEASSSRDTLAAPSMPQPLSSSGRRTFRGRALEIDPIAANTGRSSRGQNFNQQPPVLQNIADAHDYRSPDTMVPDGNGGYVSIAYATKKGMIPDGHGGFLNPRHYVLRLPGPPMHPGQMGGPLPYGAQLFPVPPPFGFNPQAAMQSGLAQDLPPSNMTLQNVGAQDDDGRYGIQDMMGLQDPKRRPRRRARSSRSTSAHSLARAANYRASRENLATMNTEPQVGGDAAPRDNMSTGDDQDQRTFAGAGQDDDDNAIMNMTDEEFSRLANAEYGRYMDDLNRESRARGDTVLAGDVMSGESRAQVRFNIQPPTPARGKGVDRELGGGEDGDDEVPSREERGEWTDLMGDHSNFQPPPHHLNPAVFDPVTSSFTPISPSQHLLSATRPGSKLSVGSLEEAGRQSEPLRARPTLLSPIEFRGSRDASPALDINSTRQRLGLGSMIGQDNANRIFGELPGSINSSRNSSPGPALQRSVCGRRLYEK